MGVGKAPNRTHSPENIKICEKCLNRCTKFYEYTKKECGLLLERGLWLSRVFAMVTAVFLVATGLAHSGSSVNIHLKECMNE